MTTPSLLFPFSAAPVYPAGSLAAGRPPAATRAHSSAPVSSPPPQPYSLMASSKGVGEVGGLEICGHSKGGHLLMEAVVTGPAPAASTPALRGSPGLPWEKLPGENNLWYARFVRYVALGPGRSVSLVSRGRKNAYPIPAHWPVQAKQNNWKARAEAFDAAAAADPSLIASFDAILLVTVAEAAPPDEAERMRGLAYQVPKSEDDEA